MKINDKYYNWGTTGWDSMKTYTVIKVLAETGMVEYEVVYTNKEQKYTKETFVVTNEQFVDLKLSNTEEMVEYIGEAFNIFTTLELTDKKGHHVTSSITQPGFLEFTDHSIVSLVCSCGGSISRRTEDIKSKYINDFLTNTEKHAKVYTENGLIEFNKQFGNLHIYTIKATLDILQVPSSYYDVDFKNAVEGEDYIVNSDGTVDKLYRYEIEGRII